MESGPSVLERLNVLHAVLNDEIHDERLWTEPYHPSRILADLLVDIFVYSKLSPLVLGEVCRSWRRAAHNHARLWSSIWLAPPRRNGYDERYHSSGTLPGNRIRVRDII